MLKTEFLIQNVPVHSVIGITTKLYVQFVDICAKLVKPKNIVGLVPKTESVHLLVIVQITGSMPLTSVKNVHINVNNAQVFHLIVNLVLLTELMPQLVTAQLVLITLKVIQYVTLVPHNVLPVPIMMYVPHLVLVTE